MGKPDAPEPTDPRETSAASTSTNVGTAIANTMMGNVTQVGPGGSLTYDQTGTYTWKDPYTGQSYDVPQFTATTSLSPEMQSIYSGVTKQAQNVVSGLSDYQPMDAEKYRTQAQEAILARMAPQQERDRASMEARLANQGIGLGSKAYSAASADYSRAVDDARLGAILAGTDEAAKMMQMDAAARAAPINEINALLSTGQVATPQFAMNSPSTIATTDTAGLINQSYNQAQQNYQTSMGAWNNTWGGLFGLGAAAISDVRLKENINRIGATESGIPIYTFSYIADPEKRIQVGVMAQEVLPVIPEAVITMPNGFYAVDYSKVK